MTKQRKRSRRKRTLKLLQYAANAKARIKHWPRYESGFSGLSVQLANAMSSAVMDNTWDASSLENWEWDEYNERFTFDVLSVFRLPDNDAYRPVTMSSRFHVDPRKDLTVELDRVSGEIKAYSDNLLAMQKAFFASLKATDASG